MRITAEALPADKRTIEVDGQKYPTPPFNFKVSGQEKMFLTACEIGVDKDDMLVDVSFSMSGCGLDMTFLPENIVVVGDDNFDKRKGLWLRAYGIVDRPPEGADVGVGPVLRYIDNGEAVLFSRLQVRVIAKTNVYRITLYK